MREATLVLLFCLPVALGCRTARQDTKNGSISVSDECNGLILRLTVSQSRLRDGDVFAASAVLENTAGTPLALHYVDIAPMYVLSPERDVPIAPGEMSHSWRYAYCDPVVLEDRKLIERGGETLLGLQLPADDVSETKELYESMLETASYGDFYPSFVIPARSTITATQSFKACRDRSYVDVGLFCLKNYYSKPVLAESGLGAHPDERTAYVHGVKLRPKIWIGSLYVGIKLDVE